MSFFIAFKSFIFCVFLLSVFILHPLFAKTPNDTLVVAFESKIQTADPRLIGSDPNSQYLEELRFLPLISFDETGALKNVVAEKISPTSKKSWEIKIRKDLKFANGKALTAEDVIATYQAILTPKENFPPSPRKGAFEKLHSIKLVSPDTLEIVLKEIDASFLVNLVIGILPKEAIENAKPGEVNDKGYESGPYILQKMNDTEWNLTKNSNYTYTSSPKIPNLTFKIITDAGTRYAALVKGEVDIVQNAIDPDKVVLIQKQNKKELQVITAPRISVTYIGLNFKDPVFQNKNLREAIAYGIHREEILTYRMQNSGTLAKGIFPPNNFFFNPQLPDIKYDLPKAKLLLKNSGVSSPKFSIAVSSSNRSTIEIAKAIASNLKLVGFHVNVEALENTIFTDRINRGVVQAWISNWVGFKDADHLHFIFGSNMVPPAGRNRGFYSNKEVDKLLEEGIAELDFQKRKAIYDKAQLLLAHDFPYINLWHSLNVAVINKSVEGYKPYADGRYWSVVNVTKK